MQSRWSDADARVANERWGETLGPRLYTSRLLGADPALVLHVGGNTSLKGVHENALGESVPALAGEGVLTGSRSRRWDLFDLGARSGSARLRFRFVSGDSVAGAGWEIARVEVGVEPTGAEAGRAELVAEPNPVRIPAPIVFRVSAPLTWTAQPTTLGIYDARGRLVRVLVHEPVPA